MNELTNIQVPTQPSATKLGEFGIPLRNYASDETYPALPSVWIEGASKRDLSLSIVTRASVLNVKIDQVITNAATIALLDLEPDTVCTQEQIQEAIQGVLLSSLKIIRMAGNPDKTSLELRGSFNVNRASAINSYSKWTAITARRSV